ncbi:unnamed protein product, partial [Prorocentrum cordatum]
AALGSACLTARGVPFRIANAWAPEIRRVLTASAGGAPPQAAAALDVDVQLVQVDLGPQKAEELAGGWLAAAQDAEGGMCAAVPVGTGYCDAQSMTYARGGSCTGSYCAGLATIEQCCDVVAAMPECAGAEHVGFIPASGPEG